MKLSDFRQYFPITKTDIYLNHAAISPFSTKVTERINWYLQQRQTGPIDTYEIFVEERNQLRKNIAGLINAKPENIAIIGNTSEGFNWLVHGLDWQEGDSVLLTDYEFPSNVYPFLNLQSKGVKIEYVSNKDGIIYPDDIEEKISAKTRILSISFVEFLNGFRNNMEEIGKICNQNNVIFSVDGIQGIGALPFDVQKYNVSFISNGGHKWLMAPCGAGFMFIAPNLHNKLKPAFAGWLSVKDSWNFLDYKMDLLDTAERYEIGSPNAIGIFGLKSSTDLLLQAGTPQIEKHLTSIGKHLVESMSKLGFKFLGSAEQKYWSGIFSFKYDDIEKVNRLFDHLKQNKIHLSLRNSALRISPHFYNTKEEIDIVINTCESFMHKKIN